MRKAFDWKCSTIPMLEVEAVPQSCIPVYRWFADEIGLCVALALYLCERKNSVWLFEHLSLLAECIGFKNTPTVIK
jgi:hypothetical protein